jgi:hypothetical protein
VATHRGRPYPKEHLDRNWSIRVVALRQELVVPSGMSVDGSSARNTAGELSLPASLQAALVHDMELQQQHGRPLSASKLFIVTACEPCSLRYLDEQTHCNVEANEELGVFVVEGRRRVQESWSHHMRDQAGPARDKDWEQHEWTEKHDGDRWLAVCSADMAQQMAHQGFVLTLAPSAASLSPFVVASARLWTREQQVESQLARLARLHGHELAGLWVRCPVPGQVAESVPIILVRRSLPPSGPPQRPRLSIDYLSHHRLAEVLGSWRAWACPHRTQDFRRMRRS